MNNFLHPGKVCTFTAPTGGVVSGNAYLIGTILAVAATTVAQGSPFSGAVEGVFSLPKATGAWTEGEALYWDNTALNVTTVSTGNTPVGIAESAALSADATGNVRLQGLAIAGTGVQDLVLGTTAPDGVSETVYVQTTGTVTGAVPDGKFAGQRLVFVQSVAASTPVGTITGHFKTQAGVAKGTLALGTAVGMIFRGVWDGAAYRQIDALGGTGSGLS